MRNKKVLLISMILLVSLACIFGAFAHSGRTDSAGGHRDNNNKSGLGSYHYHCGGHPPHLHTNGVCPYKSGGTSSSSSTSSYSVNENLIDYEESYDYGYEKGYEDGYNEGHSDGNDEGYDEGYDDGYDEGFDDGYKSRIEEVAAERKKEINFLLYFIPISFVLVLVIISIRKVI